MTQQANAATPSAQQDNRATGSGTLWLLCVLGLVDVFVLTLMGRHELIPGVRGVYDFTGFFIGSRLLGTSKLYSPAANLALQKSLTGATLPGVIYVQPPFWAAAMKPFTLIGYLPGLVLFKLLMSAALIAFVWLFPLVPRRHSALALCWSLPAGIAVARANNAPLILLFLALSLSCWKGRRPLLAGAALGLCLMKFQFLIFLPFLLFRRAYRRTLAGFAIAGAVAVAVNFLSQPHWVRLYWQALNMPRENMTGRPNMMPNFYASFYGSHHPALGVVLGCLLVGWVLWPICREYPFELAMPLCIMGALLASPHTNDLDAVLAIPALLLVAQRLPHLKVPAYVLLSPLAAYLYCVGPGGWGPAVFVAGSLWLMYRVSRDVHVDPATIPPVFSLHGLLPWPQASGRGTGKRDGGR